MWVLTFALFLSLECKSFGCKRLTLKASREHKKKFFAIAKKVIDYDDFSGPVIRVIVESVETKLVSLDDLGGFFRVEKRTTLVTVNKVLFWP